MTETVGMPRETTTLCVPHHQVGLAEQSFGQRSNVGGRTLGGGLGFGLLGTIAAQSSRNVGAALGYYGLAWSVFSTVVARGPEVHFDKDAVVDIGWNSRTSKSESPANTPK